jgi:protoporphyrinogen oxidase
VYHEEKADKEMYNGKRWNKIPKSKLVRIPEELEPVELGIKGLLTDIRPQ